MGFGPQVFFQYNLIVVSYGHNFSPAQRARLTRSILKSWSKKSTLVNSTHFGFYERIRTIFQKFKN